MAMKTAISWTDATWNFVTGCARVSPGCKHCYAFTEHNKRHKAFLDGKLQNHRQYAQPFDVVQIFEDRLMMPLSIKKPHRFFVISMGDLFHDDVPESVIRTAFKVMGEAHWHVFQVLTKRPERMHRILNGFLREMDFPTLTGATDPPFPWPHVHIGVTVENQKATERIKWLMDTPAAVRWLSMEPLLGPVDLSPWADMLDWVVVGGESKTGARPMHPVWAESVLDQCQAAGIPYHFKQWGEWSPVEPEGYTRWTHKMIGLHIDGREYDPTKPDELHDPGLALMYRAGKRKAGRLLRGQEWNGYPEDRERNRAKRGGT